MTSALSIVSIEGNAIHDWPSFHDEFSVKIGFPSFYGRNGDAWIDCMTHVDNVASGLSSVTVDEGDLLTLQIVDASNWAKKCPDVWAGFQEMAAFVNWRRIEQGDGAVLALSYYV
ncbi:barstar family protein [Shimia sp.]|uniref:barstar family protein n=1 Tax=Shimia sp. TaxID=1954381 RepID=UPI003BA84208